MSATSSETTVIARRIVSMFAYRSLNSTRHFDDDVDRRALHARGREAPLAHGLHRALIETRTKTPQNLDVADAAVAPHDDLEHHFAGDVRRGGPRRCSPRALPSADEAARRRCPGRYGPPPMPPPSPSPIPDPLPSPRPVPLPEPVPPPLPGPWLGGVSFGTSLSRPSRSLLSAAIGTTGAITGGSIFASSGAGGGSTGFGVGSSGGGSFRAGIGLLTLRRALPLRLRRRRAHLQAAATATAARTRLRQIDQANRLHVLLDELGPLVSVGKPDAADHDERHADEPVQRRRHQHGHRGRPVWRRGDEQPAETLGVPLGHRPRPLAARGRRAPLRTAGRSAPSAGRLRPAETRRPNGSAPCWSRPRTSDSGTPAASAMSRAEKTSGSA